MMSNRPPDIPVSAGLPGDGDEARRLLAEILDRAAQKSHVNVNINIFQNPREVNVYDQSKTDSPETTFD